MKLIKEIESRRDEKDNLIKWAIFWCSFDNRLVEKQLYNGLRDKSCGCFKTKHGGTNTRLYKILDDMKQRILNPNSISYKNYGGRGITICNEWLDEKNGFIEFREWSLNNGYQENLQINRINCEWTQEKKTVGVEEAKK